jgi:ankyrin repeat protein
VAKLLSRDRSDINQFDRRGYTPLMYAVVGQNCSVAIVKELLRHGAHVDVECKDRIEGGTNVIALALADGDPSKVAALMEAGADIRYRAAHGYDALLSAVHRRDVMNDPHLLDLLQLVVANGVSLNGVSSYKESGLRVLSRLGRFDAVRLLLDAGADPNHLDWTPLMRAVALDSVADVRSALEDGSTLEAKDWWERTAWLLAVQTGDIEKAKAIRDAGADTSARGRCAKPSLFYAIESNQSAMLEWLIALGFSIEETDEFGTPPLNTAVEHHALQCVDILLRAGAEVDREHNGQTALRNTASCEMSVRLLSAGADPRQLSAEACRALAGLPADPDAYLLDATQDEFLRGRGRRFGTQNPEHMSEPFWESMIRAGVSGYEATEWFGGPSSFDSGPVWCAQRFGQTITLLPAGRVVQIAGEHEDHYDPDFCIYNDVFVHAEGAVRILGYPETVFPPTDFHTATLIGPFIYVIGSLGYYGKREFGKTPVYRLDTRDFRIERLDTRGKNPGWIYEHRADLVAPDLIRIVGGKIVTKSDEGEVHGDNQSAFVLDTNQLIWRRE